MKIKTRLSAVLAAVVLLPSLGMAEGPYKILRTTKVGGEGGFDYVYADSDARNLYVARSGPAGHIAVFNLDTLSSVGDIPSTSAHGATVDRKYNRGFATSKPVAMFDAKTLAVIKTIDVQGNPDGYLSDPFNHRVYVLSHAQPNVTVLDARDGAILGTIDLGGAPEQGVSDGKGHLYIDVEDRSNIAVVDANSMTVLGHYDLSSKGGGCAGLAMDVKNNILFAACRDKKNMIILSATDGRIITDLPIGSGSDGAVFNPATMEAFSSQGDGTLSIIKENSPSDFVVEQTLTTPVRAKTLTLDSKTGHIFLITAEFGPVPPPPPPPAAGSPPPPPGYRGPRAPMLPNTFSILEVGK